MNTIIKLALVATLAIFAQNAQAQEAPINLTPEEQERYDMEIKSRIQLLEEEKLQVELKEKEGLKTSIEVINGLLEKGEITAAQAEERKTNEAKRRAQNIQDQYNIIDAKIAYVERNGFLEEDYRTQLEIGLGAKDSDGNRVFGVAVNEGPNKKRTYDKRTYSETVVATGLNNVISDNAETGDDFSIGRSNFFEFGYAWKTRVFKNSGALQFKYGLSIQSNKLFAKRNETLVVTDGVAALEEFPFELKKSQIRTTNLVVPLHFEFGGYKKEQGEDYVRYRLGGKFRMGIGGYAGVRLGTQQKLKYRASGERIKSKERTDFGGDNFVYGVSGYIRVTGDLSIYGKYDLSSAFSTQSLGDVNNVSLGLRLDL